MGEEDGEEIDIDPLQALLRSIVPLDRPPVGPKSGLMVMLMPPEDEIVPADDGGGDDLYSDWGERVYAPGAEDDPI
jgi:hypothetical protein